MASLRVSTLVPSSSSVKAFHRKTSRRFIFTRQPAESTYNNSSGTRIPWKFGRVVNATGSQTSKFCLPPNYVALKSTHVSTGAIGIDATHSEKLLDENTVHQSPRHDPIDLSFQDSKAAFKSKTTWEVLRAYIVFSLCSSKYLVDNNMKLMKFAKAILGRRLFETVMRATFYGHFVAGEDELKIQPILKRLRSFGVKSILDYSVEEDLTTEEASKKEMEACVSAAGDEKEGGIRKYHAHEQFADRRYKVHSARTFFYLGEAQCERNMATFLKSIEAVSDATHGTGFAAIKLTALGRPQLLLQLSEVIVRARRYLREVVKSDGTGGGIDVMRVTPATLGNGNGKDALPVIEQHVQVEEIAEKLESIIEKPRVKKWYEQMTYDEEGTLINIFPWAGLIGAEATLSESFQVPDLKTGQMRPLISKLTKDEEEMFRNMLKRVHLIFRTAKELGVRVMVDAEQTYFQTAISRLTMEMMKLYNTEKAIVFNTYQCYLKDAYHTVALDLEESKRLNFYYGAKLVRGAYMEQERARAKALGYEDPVNPNFDATSAMYEKTLVAFLHEIKKIKEEEGDEAKRVAVMVASHNEDTIRFAIQKMKELSIYPQDKVVCFGQLLGMCDQISFPLGQAGYSVYKYVPYGPVSEVLPYLSRRANENQGILTKIKKERTLLRYELTRRLLRGQLFYTPKGDYSPA